MGGVEIGGVLSHLPVEGDVAERGGERAEPGLGCLAESLLRSEMPLFAGQRIDHRQLGEAGKIPIRRPEHTDPVKCAERGDSRVVNDWALQEGRAMEHTRVPVPRGPWSAPTERVGRSAAPVDREVEPGSHRLPPGLEAALESFLDQRTKRRAFTSGYSPGLPDQLIGKLDRRLHSDTPYSRYGPTLSWVVANRRAGRAFRQSLERGLGDRDDGPGPPTHSRVDTTIDRMASITRSGASRWMK